MLLRRWKFQGNEKLGTKAKERMIVGSNGSCEVREPTATYKDVFDAQNDGLVKSVSNRHPGEGRGLGHLEKLDSGFRRNDEFYGISTF
jgi:hypothetical protein